MGEIITWLLFFFILIALLVLVVYQLMCLADLEFDYINPYDSASRINFVILPEFITHGVLCLIYLLTGHWVMFLLALPYLYYNVRLYTRNQHLVDVTEIFNQLNWEKKQRLFKLGYLVLFLFITLFWFQAEADALEFEDAGLICRVVVGSYRIMLNTVCDPSDLGHLLPRQLFLSSDQSATVE